MGGGGALSALYFLLLGIKSYFKVLSASANLSTADLFFFSLLHFCYSLSPVLTYTVSSECFQILMWHKCEVFAEYSFCLWKL